MSTANRNDDKINQQAIQIAKSNVPLKTIEYFKVWNDCLTTETRHFMIGKMLTSSGKANMLINGCHSCLTAVEAGNILICIFMTFSEEEQFKIRMPLEVYSSLMKVIIDSSHGSAFIKRLVELNVAEKFRRKFKNYLSEKESVNSKIRIVLLDHMKTAGRNRDLEKIINILPDDISKQPNQTIDAWDFSNSDQ